jgi:hypothetical protein
MAYVVSSTLANQIPTVVAARALARIKSRNALLYIARKDFSAEVAQFGATINVPIPPTTYSVEDLTEGNAVTQQVRTIGNAQIVLDKHKNNTFAIADRGRAVARPDVAFIHADQAAANLADAIGADLGTLYASYTGGVVGSAGVALGEGDIITARTNLVDQKVPVGDPLFLWLSPTQYGDLAQIDRATEYRMSGMADALTQGKLQGYDKLGVAGFQGQFHGFLVFEDQAVSTVGGTVRGAALHRDALLVAFRPLPVPEPGTGAIGTTIEEDGISISVVQSYKSDYLGNQWTLHAFYGRAVGRAAFAVEVRR